MSRKLTLEEIKDKLRILNPDIEILSKEYKNVGTELKLKCIIDNYEWEKSWDSLRRFPKCPKCSGTMSLTLEIIKERLKIINPNIKILSEEYINSLTKLKCVCLIDGYIWNPSWNSLQSGNSCPICSGIHLTLEVIKERLKIISPNIEILSKKYINATTKLECKCLVDGHIWSPNWNSLSNGCGCPVCAGTIQLTIEKCKERLKSINPNIEILADTYTNAHIGLKCICKIDGYIWHPMWNHLQGGEGCPKCIGKVSPTSEEIKEEFETKGYTLLPYEYKTKKTKLPYICSVHPSKIQYISWDKIHDRNQGCRLCGNEKLSESNKGSGGSNWKGGIQSITSWLRGKISQWKKDSIYNCQSKCTITGEEFNVIHHLFGFEKIRQEVLEITNLTIYDDITKYTEEELNALETTIIDLHNKHGLGICLIKPIHELFHNEYGRGGNTPQQFIKFITKLENNEFNDYLKENNLELNINYKVLNELLWL